MGSAFFDDITRALFAQLRGSHEDRDYEVLICPKCKDRLDPLLLDIFTEEDATYQRVWWTCRGLKNKKCFYPLNVPTEVFWTKRTMEQMKEGLIPLPNIHLLPKEWHHLYPNLFGPGRKADPAPDFCHASECQRAAGPSKARHDGKGSTGSVSAMSEDVPQLSPQTSPLPSTSKAVPTTSDTVAECLNSNTTERVDALQSSRSERDGLLEKEIEEAVAMPVSVMPRAREQKVIPSVLYQVDESQRKKWAESMLQLHQNSQKASGSDRPVSSRPTTSLVETQQEAEPDLRQLEFVNDEGRRRQSALSLRFSNDRFIKAVKSEIEKDTVGGGSYGSQLASTATRDIHASRSAPSLGLLAGRTSSSAVTRHEEAAMRGERLSSQEQAEKPLLTEARKLATSLSQRLGFSTQTATEHMRAAQKRPLNEPESIAESVYSQGAVDATKSFASVSDLSRTNTSSSTPSTSDQSERKKRRQRYPKGHPFHMESLGDPDVDNLVQQKLRELRKSSKANSKRRRRMTASSQATMPVPAAHSSQQMPRVDEFGFPIASTSEFASPVPPQASTSLEQTPVQTATLSYTPDAFSITYAEEDDLAFGLDSY
ncbi:Protein Y71G12B.13 [Aphelenchoides avenae]|nr:Protein Y71G12B.13 [Aphelenchus avenae]